MAEILDETDLQILKTLQKNAKLTTKELADAVHLTPTPVFERQKRLEKRGYKANILHFVFIFNYFNSIYFINPTDRIPHWGDDVRHINYICAY